MNKKMSLLEKTMKNNKEKLLKRYKRKTDLSLNKLSDWTLSAQEEADIMSSLIMMYKESRNLLRNEFLEHEDFMFIFYLMEYSSDSLMKVLNRLEFSDSKWIYLIYTDCLEEIGEYAEQLELYEISSNIKKWLNFYVEKTFDFENKEFKINIK